MAVLLYRTCVIFFIGSINTIYTDLTVRACCRQSLDNEKQCSSLRDRVTLLLGVVTEIIFLESGLGLLSLILRTLSRLLLRTQYYSMLKTARRINIS